MACPLLATAAYRRYSVRTVYTGNVPGPDGSGQDQDHGMQIEYARSTLTTAGNLIMSLAQPNNRIRLAEKQVARYREDVGDWQNEHDTLARTCWPIEDLISNGNHYLQSILRLDAAVRQESLLPQGGIEAYLAVRFALREWVEISQSVLKSVEMLEEEYGGVEGAAALRENVEMVERRLDSARPIAIDDRGGAFEVTGERIILPGITPEDLLESLEDERQGRLHRLSGSHRQAATNMAYEIVIALSAFLCVRRSRQVIHRHAAISLAHG